MLKETALRQHCRSTHCCFFEKQEAVNILLPTSAEDSPIPYFICLIKVRTGNNLLRAIISKAELGKDESCLQNNWLTDIGINLE